MKNNNFLYKYYNMNYKYKYQKYKNKYLELVKQKGGNLPLDNYLKNINLFEIGTDIEKYLNPFYGYIWINYGVINNYYRFYNEYSENNNYISYLIHRTFFMIGNTILPTKKLDEINIEDYAQLLGNLFLLKNDTIFVSLMELLYNLNLFDKNNNEINDLSDFLNVYKINFKEILDIKYYEEYNEEYNEENNEKKFNEKYKEEINIDNLITKLLKNIEDKHSKNIINTINLLKKNINDLLNKKKIKNKIFKIGIINEKIIYDNFLTNINIFYWLLSLLFYKLSNKEKIKIYYEEINKILPENNKIIINSDYIEDNYTFDDLNTDILSEEKLYEERKNINNYMSYAIIMLKKIYNVPINLYTQKFTKTYYCNKIYSDCGETTLRNFINVITYDFVTDSFNLDKLNILKPNIKLKEYYKVFNNFQKQNNDDITYEIFCKKLNPRDAWDFVISNMPNVNYNNFCDDLYKTYKYEIKSGLSKPNSETELPINNMFQVLKNLFLNISSWNSFEINDIKIIDNLDEKNEINIIVDKYSYIWKFMTKHYDFIFHKNNTTNNIVFFEKYSIYKFYENIYTINNYDILNKKYSNWYYFKLKNDDDILNFFNTSSNFLTDETYTKIFEYILMNFDNDKLSRTTVDMLKVKNFISNNLYIFNDIEYYTNKNTLHYIKKINTKLKFNTINLKKIINKIPCLASLTFSEQTDEEFYVFSNKLINLTFDKNFNSYVDLDNLINLTHLTFGDNFNKELKLDNLINLTHLTFGTKINVPINLDNLNNLTYLSCNSYIYGFNNLTKLTNLILSGFFNQNLDLSNLTNLTNLTLHVNETINLDKLINLQTLTFGNYFNKVVNLDNLTKLNTLTFGYDFNQPVNLEKLINLNILTFGHDFNQSVNLETLINLNILTFGNNFNKLIEKIPKKLSNLTFNNVNFSVSLTNYCINTLIIHSDFDESLSELVESSLNDILTQKINCAKLTNLSFENDFNKEIDLSLYTKLKYLTFDNEYNQKVFLNSLINLTHLTFGYAFNQPVDFGNLTNLTHLTFGFSFNQYIDFSTLTNLTHLTLGFSFNQQIDLSKLTNLTHLVFGYDFNQQIDLSKLTNLTHLTIFNLSKKMINDIKKLKNLSFIKTQYKYLIPIHSNNKNNITVDFLDIL
jgi:hypothetical protein